MLGIGTPAPVQKKKLKINFFFPALLYLNMQRRFSALNQCCSECGSGKRDTEPVMGYKPMHCFLHQESLAIKKKKKSAELNNVFSHVADLLSDSSSSCHWRLWTNCSRTGLRSSCPFTLGFIHSGRIGINYCLFLPKFDSSIKTETVRILF